MAVVHTPEGGEGGVDDGDEGGGAADAVRDGHCGGRTRTGEDPCDPCDPRSPVYAPLAGDAGAARAARPRPALLRSPVWEAFALLLNATLPERVWVEGFCEQP